MNTAKTTQVSLCRHLETNELSDSVNMAASDLQQLQILFKGLSDEGRQALLDYAKFLCDRYPADKLAVQPPGDIRRPEQESVVVAIRRLSETYPMLDRQALLHETAAFVMQHVIQGKEASEVIDRLEAYFKQQYESLIERQANV